MFGTYFQPPVSPLLVGAIAERPGSPEVAEEDGKELEVVPEVVGTVPPEETRRAKSKSRVKAAAK